MSAFVFFALLVPVMVMSGTAPPPVPCQLVCPRDSTNITNDAGVCYANVTFTLLFGSCSSLVTGADFSDEVPSDQVDCAPQSLLPVGPNSVCCRANLGISLEPEPCCFGVTVEDAEPPVVTCPADILRCNDADDCGAIVPFAVGDCDNCGPVSTECVDVHEGTYSTPVNPLGGEYFDVGVHNISCVSKDQNDLEQACEFAIEVVDCQDPTIVEFPGDIVVDNDPGECSAVVPFTVNVTDNCNATVECFPNTTIFDVGVTRVTCVAEDVIKTPNDIQVNTDEIAFDITVEDVEAPIVTCEEIEGSVTTSSKEFDPLWPFAFHFDSSPSGSLVEVSATDNCGAPPFIIRDSGVIVSLPDDKDVPDHPSVNHDHDHEFLQTLIDKISGISGGSNRRLLLTKDPSTTAQPSSPAPTSTPTSEACEADRGFFGVGELFTSEGDPLVVHIEQNPDQNPTVKKKDGVMWIITTGIALVVAEDGAGNQACIECTLHETPNKKHHPDFGFPISWQW